MRCEPSHPIYRLHLRELGQGQLGLGQLGLGQLGLGHGRANEAGKQGKRSGELGCLYRNRCGVGNHHGFAAIGTKGLLRIVFLSTIHLGQCGGSRYDSRPRSAWKGVSA